ncbi:membrane dipeptidase [Xinfangfangia sp. D13-10-4-6]|uniref:dipeptidase n=1 Tax=Pseudogemmobacter hezensis TaxID=2737662 RepID=UPI001554D7D0|nr:dipeptidase [Pseudogemmobacter hezensis]NPD14820.1 membrane dipeptidase [Pseudogemmobacter hezensis]
MSTALFWFDGHNDTLLRLWEDHRGNEPAAFLQGAPEGKSQGHIDLPKARAGGLAGGLCAIFIMPDPDRPDKSANAPRVGQDRALRDTHEMLATLIRLDRAAPDALRLCKSRAEVDAAIRDGAFAAIAHIEGAEMIGPDLDALYVLHAAGLRSLGPVWSSTNIFAHGVPFAFPSTPDIGPGLTAAGRDLLRSCNELGVLFDLSHLNEAGFWDVARLSRAPLIASHSNAHAIAPHSRNLTDRQLDAIRDSDGLVGINLGGGFLNPEGIRTADLPLDLIRRHVDYIARRIGIRHLGLGSDFDGTVIPKDLAGAQDLPKLAALLQQDFNPDELAQFAHGNWLRMLEQI